MSNLDNLTAKILAEAQEKAAEITEAAKREAEAKIAQELLAANAESDRIAEEAKAEAERQANQLVQAKMLAVRDENLAAKRDMLDKVFGEALKRLNNMPKEDFVKFLNTYLKNLSLSGESLYVPAKYGIQQKDIKAKDAVLAKGGARNIEGGFMLAKDGIEQNHTFAALLDYYRDELESEVLKILYAD